MKIQLLADKEEMEKLKTWKWSGVDEESLEVDMEESEMVKRFRDPVL